MPGEVFHLPVPTGRDGATIARTMEALDTLLASDIEPERVAAVIIEPIQGEGGFHVASTELLQQLRATFDRHGILLIADEVQTGFARTGRWFGIEHSGVAPDLITAAKSLAGGFPLSAMIGRAEVMDAVEPGGLGGTYGGAPVACAAALAVLDAIADEGLNARADAIGERIRASLESHSTGGTGVPIGNVRGRGAMIGFDVLDARRAPDPAETKRVCEPALAAGLILLSCGTKGEAIRILVPLTASDALIDEGLGLLRGALSGRPSVVADSIPSAAVLA